MSNIQKSDLLFEVKDVFGKHVRTTRSYWNKIFFVKHKEVKISSAEVIKVLENPDEVRRSVQDPYIYLYYKNVDKKYLVVVVKYLNNHGFIVTIYQTSKVKRKGEKVWPR
jgi:hypothetical protein